MSKKSIVGLVLSVVFALAGIYFVGINAIISWSFVVALAISTFLTDKSLYKDELRLRPRLG